MRRLLLILAAMASVLAIPAAPAAAATTCVSADEANYRQSLDGAAGTLTITAAEPLCAVSLASYTSAGTSGHFLYDSATARITRSVTLKVAVPSCHTWVVAFLGSAIPTELTSPGAPPASYAGGATACTPAPTVTYANACDGTFTATLANAIDAGTPAVFVTGGRRIRLSPGRSTTIKVAKGATLTVRDSTFTTHVATWRTPATACPAPTRAVPPAAHPTTTPTASPSPSPSTSRPAAAPSYADAPAAYPRFADAKAASTPAPKTGMGSLVAIAVGLLMIGTGVAALTYLVRSRATGASGR